MSMLALFAERPVGAVAFLLPLVLVLLALRRSRPVDVATGTLALWDRGGRVSGRRKRRPPPLPVWVAALALALGALALVGPRWGMPQPRTWTVALDTRPSVFLPVDEQAEAGAVRSRLTLGVERATELIGSIARPSDRVRWRAHATSELILRPRVEPPADWLADARDAARSCGLGQESAVASASNASGPVSGRHTSDRSLLALAATDGPTLFVTDLEPRGLGSADGLVAVGAQAVPGPIGSEAGREVHWDGERLVDGNLEPRERSLSVSGTLPEVLQRFVVAYAAARGFRFATEGTGDRAALVLQVVGQQDEVSELRVGRDGWRASAVGGALVPEECETVWLYAAAATPPLPPGAVDSEEKIAPLPAVTWSSGRVRIGLTDLDEPDGDPAAFAVSWGELFDRAMAPRDGHVPLVERRRSGDPLERLPRAARSEAAAGNAAVAAAVGGSTLDAWLTIGALVALAIAVALER